MGEQVTNRDGSFGIDQGARGRSFVLGIGWIQNFHILEFGNEVGDRLVQHKAPFFVEHHGCNTGDRFGHRTDPENAIGAHGLLGLSVGHPERSEIGNLAVTGNEGYGPGDTSVVDTSLDGAGNAFQAFR